jgi:hypothetical protein
VLLGNTTHLQCDLADVFLNSSNYANQVVHVVIEAAYGPGCALNAALQNTPAFILHSQALPQDAQIFVSALQISPELSDVGTELLYCTLCVISGLISLL